MIETVSVTFVGDAEAVANDARALAAAARRLKTFAGYAAESCLEIGRAHV